MNDVHKVSVEESKRYSLPIEVLMDPRYTHRYIDPTTGKLRSPEDIEQNEKFWKTLPKPAEMKGRP